MKRPVWRNTGLTMPAIIAHRQSMGTKAPMIIKSAQSKPFNILLLVALVTLTSFGCSSRTSGKAATTHEAIAIPTDISTQAPVRVVQPVDPACYWELIETTDAMSGGSDASRSASWSGNGITTSYMIAESDSCGGMTFSSSHTWTAPGYYLTPGEILSFDVGASWSASGDSTCNSMSTGVSTWLAAGATTITARRGNIVVSTEPSGGVSSSGEWTVPGGSEGKTLSIRAHGEQGGVGGTVFYTYRYTCGSVQTVEEGGCEAIISNISGLKPGDTLSPAAGFVDDEGNPTTVIGSAWFINGAQTPSIVWDGNNTMLELQYTCNDHSGHSKTITIPAYEQQTDDTGGEKEFVSSTTKKGGVPPAAAAAGVAVGTAGTVMAGRSLLKKKTDESETEEPKQKTAKKKKTIAKKKTERKSLLDSEKEAISQYQETMQKMSNAVDKTIDLISNMHGLSPEGRRKMTAELKQFKESLDKVSETAGNLGDNLEKLQNIRDTIQEIGSKYRKLQKAHMQAFKELEDLPEGAAHQLADLTTAIEGIGMAADSVFKRIPYFKHIYSEEYFQTMQSFKEFGKGVRRTFAKTIFRSAVEGKKELSPQELRDFGDTSLDKGRPPEVERLIKERKKKAAQANKKSWLKKIIDLVPW